MTMMTITAYQLSFSCNYGSFVNQDMKSKKQIFAWLLDIKSKNQISAWLATVLGYQRVEKQVQIIHVQAGATVVD